MEHIEQICSLESKLLVISTCSIRIHSRKWDTAEKPLQHTPNENSKNSKNIIFPFSTCFGRRIKVEISHGRKRESRRYVFYLVFSIVYLLLLLHTPLHTTTTPPLLSHYSTMKTALHSSSLLHTYWWHMGTHTINLQTHLRTEESKNSKTDYPSKNSIFWALFYSKNILIK